MIRDSILIVIFFLALSAHAADPVTAKLEEIYTQYESVKKGGGQRNIEVLINLDQKLRKLIDRPWMVENRSIDGTLWVKKYSTLV